MKLFGLIAAILAVAGVSIGSLTSSSTSQPIQSTSITAPVSTIDLDEGTTERESTGGCSKRAFEFHD